MKHLTSLSVSLLILVLSFPPTTVLANDTQTDQAIYTVTFASTWSNESHPHSSFPGSAHFSPLIGASHTLSSTLWMSGEVASAGMEQMAETGATNQLRTEIAALGANALETVSGPGLGRTPGTVSIAEINVTHEHPAVTLVTMIAPSPDWFVGVHGLSLLDGEGEWQDEVTVTLYPYDAGTDDGTDYTSSNADSTPPVPISLLTGVSPFSAAPIGTLTFTRQLPQQQLYLPVVLR